MDFFLFFLNKYAKENSITKLFTLTFLSTLFEIFAIPKSFDMPI